MNEDFFTLMEKYNPLAFREPDGKVASYKDYAAAYEDCIEKAHAESLRGYFDVPLFLMHHCAMDRRSAEDYVPNFIRAGVLERDVCGAVGVTLIDWSDYKYLRAFFERFLTGMHSLIETKFDKAMFLQALNHFCMKNDIIMA